MLAAPQGAPKRFANRITFSGFPTSGAVFYLPFLTCSPVNGSIYSYKLIWSLTMSLCNCFFLYSCIAFLFLPLYTHIIFSVSDLYPFLSFHISLVSYISVQILCDTCNSILYVRNFLYQVFSYLITSFEFRAVAEPAPILS